MLWVLYTNRVFTYTLAPFVKNMPKTFAFEAGSLKTEKITPLYGIPLPEKVMFDMQPVLNREL